MYSLPVICLRFFTVYGPRQRPDMAIRKFVKSALEKNEIEIYGDGSSIRDYTFIEDIVNGIIAAFNYSCEFEIFNFGNSFSINLLDLVRSIATLIGKDVKISQRENQLGNVPLTIADINKASSLLNFKPQTTILEDLKKYIEWYMSVPSKAIKNKLGNPTPARVSRPQGTKLCV